MIVDSAGLSIVGEGEWPPALIRNAEGDIETVAANTAYDTLAIYYAAATRRAKIVVLNDEPRKAQILRDGDVAKIMRSSKLSPFPDACTNATQRALHRIKPEPVGNVASLDRFNNRLWKHLGVKG